MDSNGAYIFHWIVNHEKRIIEFQDYDRVEVALQLLMVHIWTDTELII